MKKTSSVSTRIIIRLYTVELSWLRGITVRSRRYWISKEQIRMELDQRDIAYTWRHSAGFQKRRDTRLRRIRLVECSAPKQWVRYWFHVVYAPGYDAVCGFSDGSPSIRNYMYLDMSFALCQFNTSLRSFHQ